MHENQEYNNVYRSLIWDILARKTWKHITKIKDINGESGIYIAKIHKVTPNMISFIKHGKFYNNIQG